MALILNLTVDQGSTFTETINLLDANGLPLNISNKNFRAQFRKTYTSSNLTDFSCTVISESEGKISISLTSDVTRNVKPGRYVYDVEMYDNSTVTRVREGIIEFTPAATDPTEAPAIFPYRLTGTGSPEGIVTASPGYSYIDTASNTLYFKVSGYGTTGWQAFVQL